MATAPLHRRLDWDSDFWGLEVASVPPADDGGVADTLFGPTDAWCEAHGIDVAFLRIPGTEVALLTPAVRSGFDLLEVTTVLQSGPGRGDWRRSRVRNATPADSAAIGEMAASSFRPWGRFYADPRMRDRADDFYRTWAVNSLAGFADLVLVTDDEEVPSGFVTGHLDGDVGRLGLLGVSSRGSPWSRVGVVRRLLRSVLDRFGELGATRVLLETQSHNRPMQALLASEGCTLDGVSACLHKWYR